MRHKNYKSWVETACSSLSDTHRTYRTLCTRTDTIRHYYPFGTRRWSPFGPTRGRPLSRVLCRQCSHCVSVVAIQTNPMTDTFFQFSNPIRFHSHSFSDSQTHIVSIIATMDGFFGQQNQFLLLRAKLSQTVSSVSFPPIHSILIIFGKYFRIIWLSIKNDLRASRISSQLDIRRIC